MPTLEAVPETTLDGSGFGFPASVDSVNAPGQRSRRTSDWIHDHEPEQDDKKKYIRDIINT